MQAVNAEYARANARMGPYQEVIFKEDMITLDIPKKGIALENGWTIAPDTYPGVGLLRIVVLYFNDMIGRRSIPTSSYKVCSMMYEV